MSPFYNDIMFMQQPRNAVQRKLCFLDAVPFGIDGITGRRANVGFFEDRAVECRTAQIAPVEEGTGQIAAGKIDILGLRMFKNGLFNFCSGKGGMIQHAAVERKGESEWSARIEPQSRHFTLYKQCITHRGVVQHSETKITAGECAVNKGASGKIGAGEIAVDKRAIFVYSLCQRVERNILAAEGCVLDIVAVHCVEGTMFCVGMVGCCTGYY